MKITTAIPVIIMLAVAVLCFTGTAPVVAGLAALAAAFTTTALHWGKK